MGRRARPSYFCKRSNDVENRLERDWGLLRAIWKAEIYRCRDRPSALLPSSLSPLPSSFFPLPSINCQLSTVNCQLSTVTSITNLRDPSHWASKSWSQIFNQKITLCQCFRSPLKSLPECIIQIQQACKNFICLNQLGGLSCQYPKWHSKSYLVRSCSPASWLATTGDSSDLHS